MQPKKLTVLVAPLNAVGHVNACLGTTKPLLERGHRVIILLDTSFAGHTASNGFEEHIYNLAVENFSEKEGKPGEDWAKGLEKRSIFGRHSAEEKWLSLKEMLIKSKEAMFMVKRYNEIVKEAIALYSPDLIVIDMPYLMPSIAVSKIPWIHNLSVVPQVYCHEDAIPPCCSGLPSNSPRDSTWKRFRELQREFTYSKYFNDYIESLGYERYSNDASIPIEQAFLVVMAIAEELNYEEIKVKGWFNLEAFNKSSLKSTISLEEFVGEQFFKNTLGGKWSGKWVYVSLGSMGSIDLSLMNRLLSGLAKTNHKYVVSKGPRHEELSLPVNCWGSRYLPQTSLVPLVDLVITHGGNNTITEVFALGRPMLVLPLFGDQLDNAQRIAETGYGRRLDPYEFTSEQLIEAVDELLADEQLKSKMLKASRRILNSNKHQQLAELIERKLGVIE